MKKTLNHLELWQQKQRELPVKGNADAGWEQMRSMLDKRMPVTGVIKKPFRLKMPKWGLHVLVGVSLVAAVYIGSRLYLSKKQNHPAKPGTQQIHRDSQAPAANHASPAPGAATPPTGIGSPGITPVMRGGDTRFTGQTKLNNDTAQKREHNTIDSIKAPVVLIAPIRRDSLLLPAEAIPQNLVRDSIGPASPGKKDVQKDTSKANKKTPKKKKRFSIFF